MLNSDKIWSLFWFAVVVSTCLLIYGCTNLYNERQKSERQAIAELISKGTDPIVARCAVLGPETESAKLTCAMVGVGISPDRVIKVAK